MIPFDSSAGDGKPLVLIVDDSPLVHHLLRTRLHDEDVRLEVAGDGKTAVRRAEETPPALILLDLSLPDCTGFDVLRRLKDSELTRDVPVIVISGRSDSRDKVQAFDLGAIDYVTKPFDVTELRVRVRSALRISGLVQMLAQRAHIDGLTGLWNRAHFDTRWPDEISRARRYDHALSLAIVDLDHFKEINDTFGHPAGDAVLQGVGRLLHRVCRQGDVPCRYGGEELVIIMPDTPPPAAYHTAERIRIAIAELVWVRHPEHRVTCSIGVVGSNRGCPLTAEQWLERADRCLYTSKQEGRNRTTLEELETIRIAHAG